MSISKIDHLFLQTNHWERSLQFWTRLGFTIVRQWGEDGHRACQLQSGDAQLTMAELEDKSHLPDRPTAYFKVSNIEEMNRGLSDSSAVQVVLPLQKTHWGTRWIRVQDPDGNIYALESTEA
jgi:catechol 2,3-dioxygenase-like lactoylglutathione lyase family enzyme